MQEEGSANSAQITAAQELGARLIPHGDPFAIIPLSTILDSRMTPEALGILNYLVVRSRMPGGWTFYTSEIARHFKVGQSGGKIRSCLGQLEDLGYIARERTRDQKGRLTGQSIAVSVVPVDWQKAKNADDNGIESTSRFSSRGQASCGQSSARYRDKQIEEKKDLLMSTDVDGMVEKQAKTREGQMDEQASPVKAKKERAPTPQQLMPFLAVWNQHRNPARMSQHRGLDRDQTALLQQMVAGHGGDVDAALTSWTLAVQKLAAVDTRQPSNWWGDPSQPKRGLANAARHWSKHAVEHAAPARVSAPTRPTAADLDFLED